MLIYEVGPRDGLQGLRKLPTESKTRFIDLLSDTSLREIEIASFVDPKYIPQMEDATEVTRSIRRRRGVTYSALVPNLNFYPRAVDAGIEEICVFLSANEEHNIRNPGRPIEQTKAKLAPLIKRALEDGKSVRGYVSTVWGYHEPRDTDVKEAVSLSSWLAGEGVYQVSLGDTEGIATQSTNRERLRIISGEIPTGMLAVHYHTKPEDMPTKVDEAYEIGLRAFDSSTGGIGGCPTDRLLANTDTLELARHFESSGISTGLDLDKIGEASSFVKSLLI